MSYSPRWHPSGSRTEHDRRPPAGLVIAINRKPVRVVETRELDPANWTESELADFRTGPQGRPPQDWPWRPWVLVVDELPAETRRHFRIPVRHWNDWDVIGEHYAVCVHCQELHPCRHVTTDAEVARQGEAMERLMSIGPGCCWQCGDPITSRQRSIVFDGDNLLLPGGPTVIFHTRRSCYNAAHRYEERWVGADPRRRWRLQCPGHIAHHIGADECTEGALCAGVGVPHRSMEDHRGGRIRCDQCTPAVVRDALTKETNA